MTNSTGRNRPVVTMLLLPVASVAVCGLLRFMLAPILQDNAPLNLFYLAVMASSILGGIWAGLLATVLSLVVGTFFFVEPAYSFAITRRDDVVRSVMYSVVGIVVSLMSARLSELRRRSERTAEALRASEARVRRLWDTDIIGVFYWNLDGRVTDANDAYLRITGYSREDLRAGKVNWMTMTPPEHRSSDEKAIRELKDVGRDTPFEKEYIRKDGSRIWVQLGGALLEGDEGVAYCLDVQERRQAERAVRQSEQRLRLAGEAAEIGFWTWDIPENRVTLDATSRALFGLPSEGVLEAAEIRAKLHPDDIIDTAAAVTRALEENVPYVAEYRVMRPDGDFRWLAAKGDAVRDADGKAVKLTGVHWDITHRKRAEAERDQLLNAERNARSQAERANRIKDEFLATISHELRTPLNAVLGWAQILKRSKDKAGMIDEGLDIIERNARAQAKLIEDLLDMSRIMSGKVKLDVRPLNVCDALNAAIDSIRPSADLKEIALEVDGGSPPPLVMGDATRLQQVFWNLLSNAVKFTPRKGKVRAEISVAGSNVRLAISDNGIGMKPSFLEHAFNRFTQADATTTRKFGGLGLGLSIVRQLVELHGGEVRAYSDGENMGSTFTILLPLAAATATGGELEDAAGSGDLNLSGVTVLAVDDEPDARNLIAQVLRDTGASVTAVDSADEAIHTLQSSHPDVIISDIGMPGTDGYELLKMVRELPSLKGGNTPAIALTAFARPEDRAKCLLAGFQLHIAKPLNAGELVSSVAMLAKARKDA